MAQRKSLLATEQLFMIAHQLPKTQLRFRKPQLSNGDEKILMEPLKLNSLMVLISDLRLVQLDPQKSHTFPNLRPICKFLQMTHQLKFNSTMAHNVSTCHRYLQTPLNNRRHLQSCGKCSNQMAHLLLVT